MGFTYGTLRFLIIFSSTFLLLSLIVDISYDGGHIDQFPISLVLLIILLLIVEIGSSYIPHSSQYKISMFPAYNANTITALQTKTIGTLLRK